MVRFRANDNHDSISQAADNEDAGSPGDELFVVDERPVRGRRISEDFFEPGESEMIDLTALTQETKPVSREVCLQMVLDVLPDIDVGYVLDLIRERTTDHGCTIAECENLITDLLDLGEYPKENKANKKRKRDDKESWADYDQAKHHNDVLSQPRNKYRQEALDLLKDEFPEIPVKHIDSVLRDQITLFKAYSVLEQQLRNYGSDCYLHFIKIGKPRNSRGFEATLMRRGSQLPKELHAAKQKMENEAAKRLKVEEDERAEKENLERARLNNELSECLCCFDEFPLNRMVCCDGNVAHFVCCGCAKKYVEAEMGQSRYRPVCFADSNCKGGFSRQQLQQFLNEKTFERLEHMQQQEDIAAAGLDFLSECPFCDFKMECPPVEVDKEFRCQTKKCGKTSCRLCQKDTHIPLSCEEAKKDGQATLRHVVEEAMSAALIRYCNKCKHPFVKEYGCNKMTCSNCHHVQCYVCSKDVNDYDHFGEVRQDRCPLYENVEDRHAEEVKKAATEAMQKVREDNPDMSDADLMVKVSDKVKQAEDARRGRAQADADRFPYRMLGGQLRQIALAHEAAVPPPPLLPPPQGVQRPAALPAYPIAGFPEYVGGLFPTPGQRPAIPHLFGGRLQPPPRIPPPYQPLIGIQAGPQPQLQQVQQPPPENANLQQAMQHQNHQARHAQQQFQRAAQLQAQQQLQMQQQALQPDVDRFHMVPLQWRGLYDRQEQHAMVGRQIELMDGHHAAHMARLRQMGNGN